MPREPTQPAAADTDADASSPGDRPLATRQGARLARQHRRLASLDARRLQRRHRLALAGAWVATTSLFSALLLAARSQPTAAELFFVVTLVGVIALPLLARSAVPEWILQRTLRAGDRDAALATEHLSRRLADLVESTRLLRLAIEAASPGDSDAERGIWAWVTEVRGLKNADRATLESLGLSAEGVEAALLADLPPAEEEGEPEAPGAEEEGGREASGADRAHRAHRAHRADRADRAGPLKRPHGSPQSRGPRDRHALQVIAHRRMEVIAEQLEGFETALLRHRPGPYR